MSAVPRVCVRSLTRLASASSHCRACRGYHLPSDSVAWSLAVKRQISVLCSVSHRYQHSPSKPTSEGQSPSTRPLGHPWRIVSAVCVQRMPSLSREKTEIELQYEDMKDMLRMEKSRLSDFELEEAKHVAMKKERQRRALEEDLDVTQATKLEGSDEFEELQEAREAELQSFGPASRETEADRTGDMRSLQRKLDRVLYLLVKKPRKEYAWQMPQGGLEEQETLLETAKRELAEECGSQLKVDFLSNTPWAFYCYQHPSPQPNNSGLIGTKVFFLKAIHRGGEVSVDNEELVDYMWVTKEELKSYVSHDYYTAVAPMLFNGKEVV